MCALVCVCVYVCMKINKWLSSGLNFGLQNIRSTSKVRTCFTFSKASIVMCVSFIVRAALRSVYTAAEQLA